MSQASLPILYSFRRCPYAMRARMAVYVSGIQVQLREVVLRDKPQALIAVSPKATVPVLVTADGETVDESRDIMLWALRQSDPDSFLGDDKQAGCGDFSLVDQCDDVFKPQLDRYKYFQRYPEKSQLNYRDEASPFLQLLNVRLSQFDYLTGPSMRYTDIAIFPFVRQFAHVDKAWFDHCDYVHLRRWLETCMASSLFLAVMQKYDQWQPGDGVVAFGGAS